MTFKQPAVASKGMVTSNHPLASLAGTVVGPMMVTIFGAGFVNIRLADGTSTVIDNYVTVPSRATPDMFQPIPGRIDHKVKDELNEVGHRSVATGGTLLGWATAIEKYGRLSLGEVMEPGEDCSERSEAGRPRGRIAGEVDVSEAAGQARRQAADGARVRS